MTDKPVEQSLESGSAAVSAGPEAHRFRSGESRTVQLGRRGGLASVESKRLSLATRKLAEDGFCQAIRAMMDEIRRLQERRAEAIDRGGKMLSAKEEGRLWSLCCELAKHTKHVLPLTVQADLVQRTEVPIIPPEIVALLRGTAPTREELEALEAGSQAPGDGQDATQEGAGTPEQEGQR